MARVDHRK